MNLGLGMLEGVVLLDMSSKGAMNLILWKGLVTMACLLVVTEARVGNLCLGLAERVAVGHRSGCKVNYRG